MRTIIAGSRSIEDYRDVVKAIEKAGFSISEIVSGTARGPDQLGERYARQHGIKVTRFPADWNKYGRSAGYKRNETMAQYAKNGQLIAIWDGKSKGTVHMINLAKQYGITVFVYVPKTKKEYRR